jgi:hypothetical protein
VPFPQLFLKFRAGTHRFSHVHSLLLGFAALKLT